MYVFYKILLKSSLIVAFLSCSCERKRSDDPKQTIPIIGKKNRPSFYAANSNFDSRSKLETLKHKLMSIAPGDLGLLSQELEKATKNSPIEILKIADSLPPGTKRDTILKNIFFCMPKDAAELAVKWADDSTFPEDKSLVKIILNPNSPPFGPEESFNLANSANSQNIKKDLIEYVAWTTSNPKSPYYSKITAYDNVIPSNLKDHFHNQYAYGLATTNVELAIDLVTSDTILLDADVIDQIGYAAGSTKGASASTIITDGLIAPNGERLFTKFVVGWLSADSLAASNWAINLTGHSKDLALKEVAAFLISRGDRESADEYIKQITNSHIKSSLANPQ